MPYFFILPAFLVLFFGLTGLAVIARFVPQLRSVSGCLVGGAIGSLIGFVIFNVLVILAGIAPAWLAQKYTLPAWLQDAGKYLLATTLLIGPLIGSAIGSSLGFAAGFWFVYQRNKKMNIQSEPSKQ